MNLPLGVLTDLTVKLSPPSLSFEDSFFLLTVNIHLPLGRSIFSLCVIIMLISINKWHNVNFNK